MSALSVGPSPTACFSRKHLDLQGMENPTVTRTSTPNADIAIILQEIG
jgi:hypothetical protein